MAGGTANFFIVETVTCALCGDAFDRRKSSTRTTECPTCRTPATRPKTCVGCRAVFRSATRDRFCSERCLDATVAKAAGQRKVSARIRTGCKGCGGRIKRYEQLCRRCFRERRLDSAKGRKATRRALGELPKLRDIFARDKGICGICRRRVSIETKPPSPDAPTLDHIVPVTKGGTNDAVNIQLAHSRCNSKKQDRACGSQMRLLG